MNGSLSGSAWLAAADERINRPPAVERQATKDPGVRGILKRSSVVCSPESEPQKKICAGHAELATTEDHHHRV